MGQRSEGRKRKRGDTWAESEIEHLLVYLEFARAEHYPRDAADNGITVYVNEQSSRSIDVSQVQRKLQWLWYEYGPEDQLRKDWRRIYDLGIDCLSWCDLEQRRKTKGRAEQMRQTMTPKMLRSGKTILKRSEPGGARACSGTLSLVPTSCTKSLFEAVVLPTRKSKARKTSVDQPVSRQSLCSASSSVRVATTNVVSRRHQQRFRKSNPCYAPQVWRAQTSFEVRAQTPEAFGHPRSQIRLQSQGALAFTTYRYSNAKACHSPFSWSASPCLRTSVKS